MTLLSDLQAVDNGARYYSVDLHIHSYGGSHDVKDATMTPESLVDSAVRQGLGVIAITDHNSNANVARAIEHANNNHLGRILVLPGVEITTAHGHLLAYFSPDRIENLSKLLSRIDLIGDMGADNTRTAKSMADTIAEVYKLDGICIAAHIDRDRTGFDAATVGFQNWKKDIILSPGLYGLECDTLDALSWYSEDDGGTPESSERRKMLIERQSIKDLAARHHLAHVQGSDSHSMAQFENNNPHKSWTRIKLSELSFDAFRIALIDPLARVRACASLPRSIPRVLGLAITGGFLHEEKIQLNDNLNCFIGGRGTGKSTAIRALAYAFGLNDDFGTYDNCPDSVTVFCEDENGILYCYSRNRGGDIDVKAKGNGTVTNVPVDAFYIEYFGQGELAKVAENPLKNPKLFQDFLDRHTNLRDVIETEASIMESLRDNAARLNTLEIAFYQMEIKKKSLGEIEQKLKAAEEGNLRDVVGTQSKLASEKSIRETVEQIIKEYTQGWTLSGIPRDFDQIVATAGCCTNDHASMTTMAAIRATLLKYNLEVKQLEINLNGLLEACAAELMPRTVELKDSHQRMSSEVAVKLAELKAQGVASDIPGLERLLREKTSAAKEIAEVERRAYELAKCRQEREILRDKLNAVRDEMTSRRKAQLKNINANLGRTIDDYTIFVRYDNAGITDEFESFMKEKMHGTYLQDNTIEMVCINITPSELADAVLNRDYQRITQEAKVSTEWATKIVEKLCYWNIIFDLQVLAKQPKPIITVRTKATPPKEIPVLQLSDGQRHTILLTIAMLADTNVPLVIDQPEDDLDNAFIAASIVVTLRSIKEKRQVNLVTHNANIAVLGDAELILPMFRESDHGRTKDRGSIDTEATKKCVLNILEGGAAAFLRRKEMYNH